MADKSRTVLFGFRLHPVSHFKRFPPNHSDGYVSSGDRPNCLTGSTLIPESS